MTKPKRYKRFSSEFKREAILRAGEEGMTDKAVCDEIGVSTRQFRRWRDELALLGKDAFPGTGFTCDQEMAALKRELAQASEELLRHRTPIICRWWQILNLSLPPTDL